MTDAVHLIMAGDTGLNEKLEMIGTTAGDQLHVVLNHMGYQVQRH